MTKEELTATNSILQKQKTEFEEKDINIRQEFAKAFNWYDIKQLSGYSSSDKEIKTPSWEEIFVEVGKLLNTTNVSDFKGNITELETAIEDLYTKIQDN